MKWLKEHGVDCDVIMGSRNQELLFYVEEMRARIADGLEHNRYGPLRTVVIADGKRNPFPFFIHLARATASAIL